MACKRACDAALPRTGRFVSEARVYHGRCLGVKPLLKLSAFLGRRPACIAWPHKRLWSCPAKLDQPNQALEGPR